MQFENEIKRTIEGSTFAECKEKLFKEFGNEYRIENKETRLKHVGLLGLKQKEITVVTYTIPHKKIYDNNDYFKEEQNKISEEEKFLKNKNAILEQQKDVLLSGKLNQMSKQIQELSSQLVNMESSINKGSSETPETILKIEDLLSENEFSMSYIRMITDKIKSTFSLDQLNDFNLVQRYVIDWIGESIQIAPDKKTRPPKVVIMVGPTGVGKTTTLAKFASNTLLDAKKNNAVLKPEICIVTTDTMRVGALEQLSKFGEILGKNVLKAENSQDLTEVYEEYKEHVDYIFIDTSGYSPNDSTHISEMKNILNVKMNPEIYLCVTASTKASDLNNIFRNYEPFAYDSVIVTKCDETKMFGNIISILWERHKSISYITDGQRVPVNIRKANVIDILKNLTGFDIDRIHIEDKFGE